MAEGNSYLDFEKPIIEVEQDLLRVRRLVEAGELEHVGEVERLEKKLVKMRSDIFGNLTAYQRVRLSRHIERPFTLDYVGYLVKDFVELHGDRLFADDGAIVGGVGRFDGKEVVVVGHQRGRSTQERMTRNFGMAQPEGNRKAQRLFRLAEKFSLPLILFIDTQGAYPGLEAEARGQAEAIARSLYILSELKTPVISTIIGEGGSGGALALGICDRLLMMENAIYSVITPEGCASILWGKNETGNAAEYAAVAAEGLKLTAQSLSEAGVVDEVIKEPVGGAHRDKLHAAELLGQSLARHLSEIMSLAPKDRREHRYKKFRNLGTL